jgi:2-polyprenyl-3-methyl-5-hydroxy-6-metoxy-1,4-benzoquinol methylase
MIERPHAFGEQKYSLLDNVIFFLRKRQVVHSLPDLTSKTILDLGSGYDARLLMRLLAENSYAKAIGFDMAFSPELEKETRLTRIVTNLDELFPLEDNSVDICISLAVIEHLNEPQQFLNEIFRVLKPGGTVALTTPGPTSKPLLEFLAFKLKVIDAAEILDHKNYFSSADLKRMFALAGFETNQIKAQTFIFGMNNLVTARK